MTSRFLLETAGRVSRPGRLVVLLVLGLMGFVGSSSVLFVSAEVVPPASSALSAPRTLSSPPTLSWPLSPAPVVATPFSAPSNPYGPGHRGVDLVATAGQSVLAADDGVVAFAGWVVDRGVLSIDHAHGFRTTYEPVNALVRQGEVVRRGQVVGVIAGAHADCSRMVCLHWGLRIGDEYFDPVRLVPATHSKLRLKPWVDPPVAQPP